MTENYDNVLQRITQINERIREIKTLGSKAFFGSLNTVTPQEKPLGADKEEEFTEALKEAMLQQALENNTGSAGNLPGTEKPGSVNDFLPSNKLQQGHFTGSIEPHLKNSENTFDRIIQLTSQYFGIDSNLIRAVIKQESDFNPNAVSTKNAAGLMQLMPNTAEELGVDDPFDPAKNIYGGTKYLQQMLSKYKGDLNLALAAYNAGPGIVDQAGGIPDIKETKQYIEKVQEYYREYSKNPINRK